MTTRTEPPGGRALGNTVIRNNFSSSSPQVRNQKEWILNELQSDFLGPKEDF